MTQSISASEYRNRFSGKKNYQALGRMKAGKMNGTEKKYAALLDQKKISGEILNYWFESVNLRLADNCFYKPDFLVLTSENELEVHEVKGYWEEDALVKIKVAAEKFPFRFIAIQYIKKEWVEREF